MTLSKRIKEIIENYIHDDEMIDELYDVGHEEYVASLSNDEIRTIVNEGIFRFFVNMPDFN